MLPDRVADLQVDERQAVDHQAELLAFDRQNHMGASHRLASNLQAAIAEEADALMHDKHVVNSAVNIAENKSKIKVSKAFQPCLVTPMSVTRTKVPSVIGSLALNAQHVLGPPSCHGMLHRNWPCLLDGESAHSL